MNRLKITEIKRRRHEERRQKGLVNAVLRSPIERPITYILNNQNRLIHPAYRKHRNAEASRAERVSLALLPRGCKASKLIFRDGFPNSETPKFPQYYIPDLPSPSSRLLLLKAKHTCKGGEVTPQTVTEAEKRDRVIFKAIEIISEWTAEEPCFVDPETAYGDRNSRFMDSVMVRLRAFKATISPSVMQILEKARNACRRTPQNINAEVNCTNNDGSPFQHKTPIDGPGSNTHSLIEPRRSPFMNCSSSSTRQSSASRPRIQVRIHDNGEHLPQISPAMMREARSSTVDPVPQPRLPHLHEMRLINRPLHTQYLNEESGCNSKNSYPVDLDTEDQYKCAPYQGACRNSCNGIQSQWGPSPRNPCTRRNCEVHLDSQLSSGWPLYRGLDIEEEVKHPIMHRLNESECDVNAGHVSITATLRHPIWDTPEEYKTRWSNFTMLE